MSKIKIKNFGPIKEGYLENDGWMEVKKVTVFIGNQGSGKSTIAKLISTFMWLEKALIRGDVKASISYKYFLEILGFHRIEDYFEPSTVLEYKGATYHLKFMGGSQKYGPITTVGSLSSKAVKLPKIMYVPAERNFLSSIENIYQVSDLIVGSLQNYLVEFRKAQLARKGKSIELPINDTKVIYDPKDDENYLIFNNKRLKLSHASSGFHSIVPLHWVTKYLIDFLKQDEKKLLQLLSPDQTIRRSNELKDLDVSNLDEKKLRAKEKKINEKYICKYLVNIVEEPEQNLFPTSQRLLLNSLLAFNNGNNVLVMTTHSPYLINYLTHSVKASMVLEKIKSSSKSAELSKKLNEIVPLNSTVSPSDWVVYELNEQDGTIIKLKDYKGLPSDANYLNEKMAEGNEIFGNLLDIEDLCQ